MINRRRLGLGLVLLLVGSACANNQLGRAVPECRGDLTSTMVIQIQSVPSAEFVPCINELQFGWEYLDLVPKLGNSRFWISSDRSGDRFLEVVLTDGCQVDASLGSSEILSGVNQYRDVTVVSSRAFVTIAPASDREVPYAEVVERTIEAEAINGRTVIVTYDQRDLPLTVKIDEAHDRGRPLIVIEQQDELNSPSTVGLALPGESSIRRAIELEELTERLDGFLVKPSYKGKWVMVFDGGCITYLFDAEGPEVETLIGDVTNGLGFFPAGEVQRQLRDAGLLG